MILLFIGFKTLRKELKIKKTGIKTTAKFIAYSYETSVDFENTSTVKVPIFEFYDLNNKMIVVKGKSCSICKTNEITTIYYNPEKPKTEYYLSKKDFMIKFLYFLFGLLLLWSVSFHMNKEFNIF